MASLVVGTLNPVVVTKGQNSEVKRLAAPEFAVLSYCQTKLKRRNPKMDSDKGPVRVKNQAPLRTSSSIFTPFSAPT